MRLAVLALFAFASACAAQAPESASVAQSTAPQQVADELMNADRAFAAAAASAGNVAALAPMLRDDVVVFAIPVPGFANGRDAAIERIGAVKEGVLRNHMILPNGRYRDSVFYSILDTEWPAVKSRLHRARLRMRDALAPHFEGGIAT